jgi:hypothetical protein
VLVPPVCLQLPLLDKAALRLLQGKEFEGLRAEMNAFREENSWVESSALFRWVPCCARCACWVSPRLHHCESRTCTCIGEESLLQHWRSRACTECCLPCLPCLPCPA